MRCKVTASIPNNLIFLRELNKITMNSLIYDAGSLRKVPVSIGGTDWEPGMPQEGTIITDIENICSNENKLESALDMFCYVARTQMFLDGNKRAAQLIANGKTGYMAIVKNTTAPAEQWIAGGVPITMMMNMERRNGEMKPVIRKALVELDGAPFKAFAAERERWARETAYVYPGPIQYWGPSEVCDQPTKTLALEQA